MDSKYTKLKDNDWARDTLDKINALYIAEWEHLYIIDPIEWLRKHG